MPSHAPRERVEHAVHELRALRAADSARRAAPLPGSRRAAASRRDRSSAAPSRSTQRSIDAEALEAPVRRHLGELAHRARAALITTCARAVRRRVRSSGGTERSSQICVATRSSCCLAAQVPRVQRLQRARARARLNSRPRHRSRSNRSAISSAASAASQPLLPCAPPARASACSIVVAGEQAEADRHVELGARVGEPARRFAGDVVEVRRVAANHGADGDERVVALGREQAARRDRQLPRARHPDDVDVVDRDAVPHERVERAVDQRLDDVSIEAAGDDGEAPVRRRSATPANSAIVRTRAGGRACRASCAGTRRSRRAPAARSARARRREARSPRGRPSCAGCS